MTQEEKELLLQKELLFKDLCARLPYGVKVRGVFINYNKDKDKILYEECDKELDYKDLNRYESLKPYLRPMSSMTKDEVNQYYKIRTGEDRSKSLGELDAELFNFYHKNHIDYRGLISMGLALEAPEDMYNTKIK